MLHKWTPLDLKCPQLAAMLNPCRHNKVMMMMMMMMMMMVMIEKKEAPAGRACGVTVSTALLPSHLDNLYRRTVSCLEDTQRSEVAALLTEFADVFAHSDPEEDKHHQS